MMAETKKFLGFGLPLVDFRAQVSHEWIRQFDGRPSGGMLPVSSAEITNLLTNLPTPARRCPGGAARHVIAALARLGLQGDLLGKIGDDDNGKFFVNNLRRNGAETHALLVERGGVTGRCLCLVTPDAERTMRSCHAVSKELTLEEVRSVDFTRFSMVIIEGFALFGDLWREVVKLARHAGCEIAWDAAGFEIVEMFHAELMELLNNRQIDIFFANEEEAEALCHSGSAEKNLDVMRNFAPLVVLKRGARGAYLVRGKETAFIPTQVVKSVDTTAAGDYFAAGVIYGVSQGWSLEKSGILATALATEIIQVHGTELNDETWTKLREIVDRG